MTAFLRAVGAVFGLLGAELAWTIWRPLPSYHDLDASGREGPEDGRPLRLVVVGDSSCTGPGLTDPADIWVRQLARRIGLHGYRVDVVSFAVGGSKAKDIVSDQLEAAVAASGDVAIVSIGGNDALRGEPLERFERSLEAIADRLSTTAPIVLLSGVGDIATIPRMPSPLALIARRRGIRMDHIHKEVAARTGVMVADQWVWAVHRFRDPSLFSGDLFHPNRRGHEVWAQVAWEALSPVLGLDGSDA